MVRLTQKWAHMADAHNKSNGARERRKKKEITGLEDYLNDFFFNLIWLHTQYRFPSCFGFDYIGLCRMYYATIVCSLTVAFFLICKITCERSMLRITVACRQYIVLNMRVFHLKRLCFLVMKSEWKKFILFTNLDWDVWVFRACFNGSM